MFDKLDNVNWKELRTASGNASYVPSAIRGLVSEEKAVQEASYWKLDNHVVLQSDLFEAAPYVVPFLLEILSSSDGYGRQRVYDLLYEIANGYADEGIMSEFDGEEVSLVSACRKVSLRGLNLYFEDLSDESSNVREKALELIVSLNDEKQSIVPRLEKLLVRENDPEFRQLLQQAIAEI